jgi:hypothetical protein
MTLSNDAVILTLAGGLVGRWGGAYVMYVFVMSILPSGNTPYGVYRIVPWYLRLHLSVIGKHV